METIDNCIVGDLSRTGVSIHREFYVEPTDNWSTVIEFTTSGNGDKVASFYGAGQVALDLINSPIFQEKLTKLLQSMAPDENDPSRTWKHELNSVYGLGSFDSLFHTYLPEGYIAAISTRQGAVTFTLARADSVMAEVTPTLVRIVDGKVDSIAGDKDDYVRYLIEQLEKKQWKNADDFSDSLKYDRRHTCPKAMTIRHISPTDAEVYFFL